MSQVIAVADDMKARLDTSLATTTSGITVIVDRQKDILSEVNKAVAKVKGAAVVILFTGYRRTNGTKTASYAVKVFSKPVMQGGANLADDIVEMIDAALHYWIPPSQNSVQDNCYFRMEVAEADLVPDRTYLIYELTATCNVK